MFTATDLEFTEDAGEQGTLVGCPHARFSSSSVCHLLSLDLTLLHAASIFRGLQVASELHFTRRFRHLRVAEANHNTTK